MKIILILSIYVALSLGAASVSLSSSSFTVGAPDVRSVQTLLMTNGNTFVKTGSNSISFIKIDDAFVMPKRGQFATLDFGADDTFRSVGAISAGSTGQAYFGIKGTVGSYDIKFRFSYLDQKNRAQVFEQTLTYKISRGATTPKDVEQTEELSDIEVRQLTGTDIECVSCNFGGVVSQNTWNTFTYRNIAGVKMTSIVYTITTDPNLPYVVNSSQSSVDPGQGGTLNFIVRGQTAPTGYPFTIKLTYKKTGFTTYTSIYNTSIAISCPGGVPSCPNARSIAERAEEINITENHAVFPFAYKVGASIAALVGVVAVVAAIFVVRRIKKTTLSVA